MTDRQDAHDDLLFKFSRLNEQGQSTQIFSSQGRIDSRDLVLGKKFYPLTQIMQVNRNQKRLAIVGVEGENVWIERLEISKGDAKEIKQLIDRSCSKRWAENHYKELMEKGCESFYKLSACPNCKSFVNHSGFEDSPQVYCNYCETIFDKNQGADPLEEKYHICEQCGYYSQPRPFTEFYFVFLLVFYYFQYNTKTKCHVCMRSSAWKMFFGNLLFVLGAPFALGQLIRAYQGSKIGSKYQGLESANASARAKKINQAREKYLDLLSSYSPAAGIQYNLALAHIAAGEVDAGLIEAKKTLSACANYHPAANVIVHCLNAKGLQKEAQAFADHWGFIPGMDKKSDEEPLEEPVGVE